MPKKLTIGLVFDDSLDRSDGVQQYVLILGRWLATQGHEVHYLVGETKRTDLPNLHSLSRNVGVRFNQNRLAIPLPARPRAIRELLHRHHFDVLHVQVPYSPALAARIIRAADSRTAVVGMFHVAPSSGLVRRSNQLLGLWLRRSLRRFDAMMSNTPATQQFAKETFRVDSQVVPLPIELHKFLAGRPFAQHQKRLNVVFVGRLVERKGCQYLLQAVAQLQAEHRSPDPWPAQARVIICGKGPLEQKLRAFTAAQGLDNLVEFAGYISEENKPRYLAGADIAIYPSTGGESFGVVLLEALAASRGVVLAGNNPGYASVLAPKPAQLFDPGDISGLAALLARFLNDPAARHVAHIWQQEYVQQFDISQIGRQTLAVYAEALRKRRR